MLSARRCCSNARHTFRQTSSSYAASQSSRNGLNVHINAAKAASHSTQDGDAAGNGSLKGKRIAIKDNIVTAVALTTAASKVLSNYTSPFDATVVKLVRQHGAAISSKTNLDEFGMGSHSQNSHYGAVQSPFSRGGVALSPGGSSGGSAVAVARGDCWAALGTDTGGSVRLPAAYTGVVGFKPSYGLLSRWGVIQYANSLDTVGVLARRVDDARAVFDALNEYDARDPTSLPPSKRQEIKGRSNEKQRTSLRIGIPHEYNIAELTPSTRQTWLTTLQHLQTQGHTLVPVHLPRTKQALSAYYVLAPAEASSNLAKYDGIRYGWRPRSGPDSFPAENLPLYARTRGEAFGEEVKQRIFLGAYTLSSGAIDNYFIQAQKIRRLVQRDFDEVFARANPLVDVNGMAEQRGEVDVLVTPTAPTLPPTVDEVKAQSSVEGYVNDVFTVPASLAGLPAASVPVRLPDGVRECMEESDVGFAGMQVIGQFGDDDLVLRAAEVIEDLG